MKSFYSSVLPILCLFFLLASPSKGFSQSELSINVSNGSGSFLVPPYIRDLEEQFNLFIIDVNSTLTFGTEVIIDVRLTENSKGLIAQGQSDPLNMPAGPFFYSVRNTEFTKWGTWDYEEGIKEQIIRTGRIPDGVYELCATVVQINNDSILGEFCYLFETFLPEQAVLISPVNGETTFSKEPSFTWSPVVNSGNVHYKLKMVEVLAGQDPNSAIGNNIPIHETTILNNTQYLYNAFDPPIPQGQLIAWVIRAVNDAGQALGENNGFSEVETFSVPQDNLNPGDLKDWKDSVEFYTAPGALKGTTLANNPCPSIQKLIDRIQQRLKRARARFQQIESKKNQGQTMIAQGQEMILDADAKLVDLKTDLAKLEADRKVILDKLFKKTGARKGKNGSCDKNNNAVLGKGGSEAYGFIEEGEELCIPSEKVAEWISQFSQWERTLKSLNRNINAIKGQIAAEESKKVHGQRFVQEGRKLVAEADAEMKQTLSEVRQLEAALDRLRPVAKECGDIITDLKELADKVRKAINEAVVKYYKAKARNQNESGADQSNQELEESMKDLKDASEKFKEGDYNEAWTAALKAGDHADNVEKARNIKKCYEEVFRRIKEEREKLKDLKELYKDNNYRELNQKISAAWKEASNAQTELSRGNYKKAQAHCDEANRILDQDVSRLYSNFRCNDGDVYTGKYKMMTDHCVGWFLFPTQQDPKSFVFWLKKWMSRAVFTKFADIADYCDQFYKLSSTGNFYDLYQIREKRWVPLRYECKNGEWHITVDPDRKIKVVVSTVLEKEIVDWKTIRQTMERAPDCGGAKLDEIQTSYVDQAADAIVEFLFPAPNEDVTFDGD